jgi:hypothetical protein
MKAQLIVDSQTSEIVQLAFSSGKTHDFALFEKHCTDFAPDLHFYADSGYEGLVKLFPNAFTPYKKPKKSALTDFQKLANRALSSLRVGVEHAIRAIKKFRILSSVYRNRRNRLDLRLKLIASFHNFFIQNVNYT